jgi:thiol-disulfide isomerase/thioredoxin
MLKVLILLLFGGLISPAVSTDDVRISPGDEAPTFSLPDVNQKYFYLRDFCGEKLRKPWKNKTKHVVVISFFATWCKPCIAEIPHLEKIQEDFTDQPVKFFLVNVGEERTKVLSFQKKKKVNLKILLDRYQKTAGKYDALTLPRLVVIDKQGIIRKEQKGFTDPEIFESEMKETISGLLK